MCRFVMSRFVMTNKNQLLERLVVNGRCNVWNVFCIFSEEEEDEEAKIQFRSKMGEFGCGLIVASATELLKTKASNFGKYYNSDFFRILFYFIGRNIFRILFKNKLPERNELFLPKRMAYVVDLDDEFDTDIPTTLIRSKADCPSVEVNYFS